MGPCSASQPHISVAASVFLLDLWQAAMLACARIGAVHSVVFAGFSAESLGGRLTDSESKVVLTATGVMRGTKLIGLKSIVSAQWLLYSRYIRVRAKCVCTVRSAQ